MSAVDETMAGCPSCPRSTRSSDSSASARSAVPSPSATVAAISALKTFDPPLQQLDGPHDRRGVAPRQVRRPRGRRPPPRLPPRSRGLAALVRRAAEDRHQAGQVADRAAGATRRRLRIRPHRGGHQEVARRLRRARPVRGAGHRAARARSHGTRLLARRLRRRSSRGAAPRSRACCATSRCSRASATPTPTRSCTTRACRRTRSPRSSRPTTSSGSTTRMRDTLADAMAAACRSSARRAQGLQAHPHAGARAHRARRARCAATPCAR